MLQLILGLLLAVIVSLAANRTRLLTLSGAIAAAVLGTIIFGSGGISWAILLLTFFLSSSLLSRLAGRRKIHKDEIIFKGSRRDAAQVLANGGIAVLCVLVFAVMNWSQFYSHWSDFSPQSLLQSIGFKAIHPVFLFLAFASSLAAANADTWSTELGMLSSRSPVLITTGKRVAAGTSGGVSLVGAMGGLGGAVLIGLVTAILTSPVIAASEPQFLLADTTLSGFAPVLLGVTLSGLAGSWVDSLLGATLQVVYSCPRCDKETERHPVHSCGSVTIYKRGWKWLNNDWVNTICTAVGAASALVIFLII